MTFNNRPDTINFVRYELKLALVYFFAKRKSLARFTSLAAVAGITAGVASLIIAQSLARGFQEEMRDKILAHNPHITVFRKDAVPIKNFQEISADLQQTTEVTSVSPTTYDSALVIGQKNNAYAVLRVSDVLSPNIESEIQAKIGAELAERVGLQIGDTAEIVVYDNDTAKNSTVRISEIFRTGLYDYDSTWIYISPPSYSKIYNRQSFRPTVLSVMVKDIYQARAVADLIRGKLSDEFKVIDWQEANQPLFAALSLEKKVSLAIISLIILIAALNITTTLAMLVNERKLDIAVLRTCGATTPSLLSIFLLEGLLLGLTGIIFGIILGVIGCLIANHYTLVRLDSAVYSLQFIPLNPSIADVLSIAAAALFLSLLATIYPAWRATRIRPLENLRVA